MKIIKLLLSLVLILGIVYSSSQIFINYNQIQQINDAYEIYYNEETEIKIKLKTSNSYFNKTTYANYDEYLKFFDDALRFCEKISKEKYVDSIDISYCLSLGGLRYLVSENRFDTYNQIISEGRYFTNEEINNGSNVVIVSESYTSNPDYQWKVGDKVKIDSSFEFSEIEVEIIGFFSNTAEWDSDYFLNEIIYTPGKFVEKISNIWLSKSNYYLINIMEPILTCSSEKEYDGLLDILNNYKQVLDINFNVIRMDNHKKDQSEFNTDDQIEALTKYSIVSSTLILVFIVMEIMNIYIKNKKQKDYEKKMLEEQEKNIQNILTINQESRKLKHDLKHFLSHISNLVEKKEYDKVSILLSEYYQEIENLEIPAFTHNRTIDLVINNYLAKSKKNDIEFTYSTSIVNALPITDRKLYILLSNALDNAFEHCSIPKKVRLEISNIGMYYRFIITNTTNEETIKKTIIATKEHGFGTMSMNQILKEIQGEYTNEIINRNYICTILIPAMK